MDEIAMILRFGCDKPGGRPLSPTTAREIQKHDTDAVCTVKSKKDGRALMYRRKGKAEKIEHEQRLGKHEERIKKQEEKHGKAKEGTKGKATLADRIERGKKRVAELREKIKGMGEKKHYKSTIEIPGMNIDIRIGDIFKKVGGNEKEVQIRDIYLDQSAQKVMVKILDHENPEPLSSILDWIKKGYIKHKELNEETLKSGNELQLSALDKADEKVKEYQKTKKHGLPWYLYRDSSRRELEKQNPAMGSVEILYETEKAIKINGHPLEGPMTGIGLQDVWIPKSVIRYATVGRNGKIYLGLDRYFFDTKIV